MKVTLAEGVTITIPVLKVLKHGEPLFLVGTDVLTDRVGQEWGFCALGIHPVTRLGNLSLVNSETGEVKNLTMGRWPAPVGADG